MIEPAVQTEPEEVRDWQAYWTAEIGRAERKLQPWRSRVKTVTARYRQAAADQGTGSAKRAYALLWANIETLKPAVYARPPLSVVSRRNRKQNPVARQASEVLEATVNYSLSAGDIDAVMRRVRDDYLLGARGCGWVRYEFDQAMQPMVTSYDPMGQPVMGMVPQITGERAMPDHVHWSDFLHEPARTWPEVGWVARRSFKTRDELLKRFGAGAAAVGLDHTRDEDGSEAAAQAEAKATVWEIWSKTHKQVFFIAKSCAQPLQVSEPLIQFEGFFPCPEPVFGTLTSDDLVPTPDYIFYQDQEEELERLSRRIQGLLDGLKLVGFVPGASDEKGAATIAAAINAVKNGEGSQLVPIPSWAAFTTAGGVAQIQYWPVEQVIKVLKGCYEARQVIVQEVYEITGVSDILRGSTDPNETATAQNIKSQWGSIRVRDRQAALVRFARDMCRLIAEVQAEQFTSDTLAKMSEVEITPEVEALLRDGVARNFVIDVETDSTIQPNEDAEKQRRVEFLQAVGQFLTQLAPVVQMQPAIAPMVGEMLKFGVRGFRAGRELEDVVDQTMDKITQMASQPPAPPAPSPDEQIKLETAKVKGQAEQNRAQADIVKTGMDMQSHALKHRTDMERMSAQAAMAGMAAQEQTPEMMQ